MAANSSERTLECDCGYVAAGEDDDGLVAAVQAHAFEVHGMTLSAELVIELLDSNTTIQSSP